MGIANIINNSTTTSGGEIVRELVNSSDGAGLHFDGAAGNIDIASPPDLGTAFSFEFVIKADEWGTDAGYFLDFSTGGRFIFGTTSSQSYNISIYDNSAWGNFGVKVLDDLKVHHLVVTVDGTAATLYDNGNQVGTLTISGSHGIDSCSDLAIGPGGTGTPMTFYRTRFYNKALTSTEVQTAFERADVDFADQYGSQTKLIDSDFNGSFDGWNTSNDWATQTNNSNAMQLVANAANQICRTGTQLTKGKRYRVTYTASAVTGTPGFSTAAATHVVAGVISAGTANSFEFTFPTSATSQYFYIKSNASGDAVTLDDISVVQIGCVSDYQTQWANPSQSLTVQDASGAADGTCSASGVTQVQPVVQLNATAARIGTTAATPADGQVLANSGKIQNSAWPALEVELSGGSASAAQLQVTADDGDKARLEVAGSTSSISGLAQGDAVLYATNNLQFGTNNSRTAKLKIDSGGNAIFKKDGGAYLQLSDASAVRGSINCTTSDGLVFSTGASFTERMTISSTGLATFSGGIALQTAGSSDTSASGVVPAGYTLSNYEYGAWSPVLFKGATQHTGYAAYGCYVRVGHIVHLSFYFYQAAGSTQTASGTWTVSNLPFNLEEDAESGYQRIPANYFSLNGANYFNATPHAWQANDAAKITLYGAQAGTDWNSGILEVAGSGVFKLDH